MAHPAKATMSVGVVGVLCIFMVLRVRRELHGEMFLYDMQLIGALLPPT